MPEQRDAQDYRFVPLDPSPECHDAGTLCFSRVSVLKDMASSDGGMTWFQPADPFHNRLALMMGRCGDDWVGTLLWAGLPCMTVHAGGSLGTHYEREVPRYLEPSRQSIHALFFEWVIGDMPTEGEEDTARAEAWPFPHDAANMVHERKVEAKHWLYPEKTGPHYDLYEDLMPESESQGYEITEWTGVVAEAMHAAEPEDCPEPIGF